MDASALGKLAGEIAKAGLPALAGALGGPGASAIANAVIGALAGSAVVPGSPSTPEQAAQVIASDPEAAKVALAGLEIQQTAATMQLDIARAEMTRESFFSWGWRPAMSWLIIVLWAYALLLLPLVNFAIMAVFKVPEWPIPPIPMDNLLGFTGIWLTIYGGGNTALRIFGRKG